MWPYTPSYEIKDSHHPYYRGCWHEFSRCFLPHYRHYILWESRGLQARSLYSLHGDLLDHTFMYCPRFSTAAARDVQALILARCGRALVKVC